MSSLNSKHTIDVENSYNYLTNVLFHGVSDIIFEHFTSNDTNSTMYHLIGLQDRFILFTYITEGYSTYTKKYVTIIKKRESENWVDSILCCYKDVKLKSKEEIAKKLLSS